MTAALTDTHCHLSHCEGEVEALLDAAAGSGVECVVDVGMGVDESEATVARAEAAGGRILAAVGLHPNDLAAWRADPTAAMDRLRDLAVSPFVVAVGETGIDTYRDREVPAVQEDSFRAHIDLAKDLDRALVIHCRDAQSEVLRILDDEGPPPRVIMHCFSGDRSHAVECTSRGFWCSFAGNITYKRNDELREAARAVPAELLLVETDAPYLAPVPHRGKPNSPALVSLTADALGSALGLDAVQLRGRLADNTAAAFGLAPDGPFGRRIG